MKLFRYWARVDVDREGREVARWREAVTAAAGWSDQSVEAARAMARERAERAAEWLRSGDWGETRDRYAYAVLAIREPIVQELQHEGRRVAAVTRNGYGAYVLNAAGVLFADIDRPAATLSDAARRAWATLRGRSQPNPEGELIDRLRGVVESRHLAARLYRTRGGHRLMVTSRTYDPTSEEARELLAAAGSDPLYLRLCEAQACFRARLSPKPWRIRIPGPDHALRFPFRDDAARSAFDAWSRRYEEASRAWAACQWVATLGGDAVHDAVQPVLAFHDELACSPDRPLA